MTEAEFKTVIVKPGSACTRVDRGRIRQVQQLRYVAELGRHSNLPWSRFRTMLARHPLPSATIVHQYAVP
jgi:hypothetical protein